MTTFLRLLAEDDKAQALLETCSRLGQGEPDPRHFELAPESFDAVPGKPFAYWVSEAIREVFERLKRFEAAGRTARRGPSTCDDFRYLRLWFETPLQKQHGSGLWRSFSKGGAYSKFYADIYLEVDWEPQRATFLGFFGRPGRPIEKPESVDCFFRPGLTWPRRTNGLSFRVMPAGCIFADKGPAAFVANDDSDELLALSCLLNSRAFGLLVSVQLARTELAQSYEVGLIQQTPIPPLTTEQRQQLATLARRAWSLKRTLDTVTETSHAFLFPAALRSRLGDYDPPAIEAELAQIQAEIDAIAFDLYGFAEADRKAVDSGQWTVDSENPVSPGDDDETEDTPTDHSPLTTDHLLSWAVGVAFGRFDWRLATGEREAPPEPDPFDPLPAKSPGMLPDGAEPFHAHAGILVDDPGHPHDLARLVEEVLERVDAPVPGDVRPWLQRDFFSFHLQRYSKSRRKAPIYWPLATASGSYTLWIDYPKLGNQTLYIAVNDCVEPKLKQIGGEAATLRNQGAARTRAEEKQFEALQAFELELIELRDTLLQIAPRYRPNHDDGAQISAAPLWPLFRHKPWQKVLKDTWTRLEKGDYDWARLAMNYWPDRVREKCKTDQSLAIAHDLEKLYVEPEAKPRKVRGR